MEDVELRNKIIEIVKNKGSLLVSEAISLLGLRDTRKNRDILRKLFLEIGEQEKFIKLINERGAYKLMWDREEELRLKEMREREELLKQKDTIIREFLKEIVEERTKRIIKKYVKENDSIIEEEHEEVKYYVDISYYGVLKKIADYKVKDIHIIKHKDIFILLRSFYDDFNKTDIYRAYLVDKVFRIILFGILKNYLERDKLDIGELYRISKVITFKKLIDEKKEELEDLIEELKEFLEVK